MRRKRFTKQEIEDMIMQVKLDNNIDHLDFPEEIENLARDFLLYKLTEEQTLKNLHEFICHEFMLN